MAAAKKSKKKKANKRKEILERLTKEKKKYIHHVSKKRKKTIHQEIKKQKKSISSKAKLKENLRKEKEKRPYVFTGLQGFDKLLMKGIPKSSALVIAGGAGSGKTIFCLQTLAYHAAHGEKCLYMSFEEPESRLIEHMKDFGLKPEELIKKRKLKIQRMNPFDITRNVDALLAQQKGELLIEVDPVIIPKNFRPDYIVVDSLTAIASAFTGREEDYRIYIEQLFRFFEKIKATSFLITETEQIPKIFSKTGVEEFLADGVVVFYNIKLGNIKERAIEVLKLRGAEHQEKIVAFEITPKGIVVYPEQEVFGGLGDSDSPQF
jgi:circadian clock protein KaiC